MKRRGLIALLIATVLCLLFFAGSATRPEPEPRSEEPIVRSEATPVRLERETDIDVPVADPPAEDAPEAPPHQGVWGVVTDAQTNGPLMNARVVLVPESSGASDSMVAITNFRGEFEFPALKSGRFEVLAYRTRFLPARPHHIEFDGVAEMRVDLQLSRGEAVFVEVVDLDTQEPVPDAKVAYRPSTAQEGLPVIDAVLAAHEYTNAEGRAELTGLPLEGDVTFTVTAEGYAEIVATCVPAATVIVELVAPLKIGIQFIDPRTGEPARRFTALRSRPNGLPTGRDGGGLRGVPFSISRSADGRIEIDGLEETTAFVATGVALLETRFELRVVDGSVELIPEIPGLARQISGGRSPEFEMKFDPGCRIRGRVVDRDGEVLHDTRMNWRREPDGSYTLFVGVSSGSISAPIVSRGFVDPHGSFLLDPAPAGEYTSIGTSSRLRLISPRELAVRPGARQIDVGTIIVERIGTLRGRVVAPDATAVLEAEVEIQGEDGEVFRCALDQSGQFRSPALPLGRYSLRARRLGGKGESRTFSDYGPAVSADVIADGSPIIELVVPR